MSSGTQGVCEQDYDLKKSTCGPEALAPSAFTISDKALEKLTKKKTTGQYGAKEVVIAQMEAAWLQKEKCLEEAHARKWKYAPQDFDELEQRLLKFFERLPSCPFEGPIIDCYKTEPKAINCNPLIVEYITCIEEHAKKTIANYGAFSCAKAKRPKPKDFHHDL